MPELTIVTHGDSAAVVLPASVLESVWLRVGDVLEATVSGDRQLILRPVVDEARRELLDEVTSDVLEERSEAYRRMA